MILVTLQVDYKDHYFEVHHLFDNSLRKISWQNSVQSKLNQLKMDGAEVKIWERETDHFVVEGPRNTSLHTAVSCWTVDPLDKRPLSKVLMEYPSRAVV